MADTWSELLSDAEKTTLEFQVDIFQGGMSTPLASLYKLVRELNDNSVGN